jgi:hypothetical protein
MRGTVTPLDLAPGRYEVRVAVHDRGTGRVGSAHISATVPDYAGAPLELSGIVLERARPSAAAGPVAAVVASLPTTVRAFGRDEPLTAFVRVYQGTARREPIQPVSVHTRIETAAGALAVDHEFVVEASRFAADRGADCRMRIPLAQLEPGEYLLSIEAAVADRRVTREVRFTVR